MIRWQKQKHNQLRKDPNSSINLARGHKHVFSELRYLKDILNGHRCLTNASGMSVRRSSSSTRPSSRQSTFFPVQNFGGNYFAFSLALLFISCRLKHIHGVFYCCLYCASEVSTGGNSGSGHADWEDISNAQGSGQGGLWAAAWHHDRGGGGYQWGGGAPAGPTREAKLQTKKKRQRQPAGGKDNDDTDKEEVFYSQPGWAGPSGDCTSQSNVKHKNHLRLQNGLHYRHHLPQHGILAGHWLAPKEALADVNQVGDNHEKWWTRGRSVEWKVMRKWVQSGCEKDIGKVLI